MSASNEHTEDLKEFLITNKGKATLLSQLQWDMLNTPRSLAGLPFARHLRVLFIFE